MTAELRLLYKIEWKVLKTRCLRAVWKDSCRHQLVSKATMTRVPSPTTSLTFHIFSLALVPAECVWIQSLPYSFTTRAQAWTWLCAPAGHQLSLVEERP